MIWRKNYRSESHFLRSSSYGIFDIFMRQWKLRYFDILVFCVGGKWVLEWTHQTSAVATTNLIIWSNTTLYGYFCWKLHQHLQRWQTTHIVNFPIFVPRNEDVKILNMFHSWKTGFLTFRYIEIIANIF